MKDLEYKQTILDTKSESFCGAKWYNATVWLGSGMTTSCHHPLPHKIDPIAVQTNPKLLHNTPEKKEQRRKMQCGERPSGCEYCWKIEDMGSDYISDRVYKSKIYTNEELDDAFGRDHNEDINLRTLEIAFDRTCNFSCSYCNPAFSSTWVKDLKTHGPYGGLQSDGRNHFTHTHDSSQLYGYKEFNPYVEAFFKWWESDLHKTLQELRVTGGEPLMSADLWKLVEWYKENANKSKTKLAINSNLGGKQDLIDKLCDIAPYMPSLDVYTSCEATGESCNYIRDGMDFNIWWDNIRKVRDAGINTHCMMTVNALCLQTLPDLIDKILTERMESQNKEFAVFSLNILRFPSFQSCLVLPQHIRNICAFRLEQLQKKWAPKYLNRSHAMHQFEEGQLTRLIEYLRTVEKPHNEAFEMPRLHNDFKQFYNQYDIRRNKNFTKTFPELESWYEEL
jgi:organic radical activating enzyme